jgi:hypothetical protein
MSDNPQNSQVSPAKPAPKGAKPEPKPALDAATYGVDPSAVEKVKVKTSGDFNLMDPFTGAHIDANSDGEEVIKTSWVADKLETGELVEA